MQNTKDSFDNVYGNADNPFYYGLQPTQELQLFLETRSQRGEALDIGCGEGRNSLLLARSGFHVQAVDLSSQGLQKLARYAHAQGIQNIDCHHADARKLPLTPNFYDAIVALTLLDHMSVDEGKSVADSLIAALKPGGFAYIEVFTTHDPGANTHNVNENISETASFIKHYFAEGELAHWFSPLETLHYEELMIYDDSHGTPHYHGVARLICQKTP